MNYFNILLLNLVSIACFAQVTSELKHKLNSLVHRNIFESANISLSVIDIESNTEIAEHRSKKVLSPASSLKLFTTYTALKTLGKDFRFKTVIAYTGKLLADGTLEGDIIIKGGGDPTLGSDKVDGSLDFIELKKYVRDQIISAGIKCIHGDIVVDESIFDSYPVAPSWQWNDLGNYYASGAWGLNVHENQYYVYFNNRKVIGNRPSIHSVSPKVPKLNLSNEIVVDSSHTGDQAYIFGGPYNYDKRIVGTIPQGSGPFSIKGSIPDPPYFFGYHLRKTLEKGNIQSEGHKTRFRNSKKLKLTTIDTLFSPNLAEIAKKANVESNNLYTESMLKMLGLEKGGQGSGQNGLATIIRLLRKYKVDTKKLQFHDGSGLSARNLINSFSIARFLSGMANDIGIDECLNYLPKGGYHGTVKGLFSGSKAKGQVWLKSGSMQGVQSYSGYLKAKSGRWVSFSIIVNGFTEKHNKIRPQLEKMITTIFSEA